MQCGKNLNFSRCISPCLKKKVILGQPHSEVSTRLVLDTSASHMLLLFLLFNAQLPLPPLNGLTTCNHKLGCWHLGSRHYCVRTTTFSYLYSTKIPLVLFSLPLFTLDYIRITQCSSPQKVRAVIWCTSLQRDDRVRNFRFLPQLRTFLYHLSFFNLLHIA